MVRCHCTRWSASLTGRGARMGALCMPPPSALPPAGTHVGADGEHAAGARRIGGKREPQRPRADDARGRAEPARAAQPLAIPIELVAVLDEGRPEDVPRRGPGRHRHRAPVPGVAVIAGMSVRHPPADVIRQSDVAVVAARRGGQVDGFPTAIVCGGVRPARVVADMESPGAIEQGRRGAQGRRIWATANRQAGDQRWPTPSASLMTMPRISLRCVVSIGVVVDTVDLGLIHDLAVFSPAARWLTLKEFITSSGT